MLPFARRAWMAVVVMALALSPAVPAERLRGSTGYRLLLQSGEGGDAAPTVHPSSDGLQVQQQQQPRGSRRGSGDVLGSLKGTANSLGLNFLVSFAEAALPATRAVFADLPVVANYVTRLLGSGLDPSLADPNGSVAASLYDIAQSFFTRVVQTRTGSIVANQILYEHDFDIYALARSRDFAELLRTLKASGWVRTWWWWTPARSVGAAEGSSRVVNSIANIVRTLVQQTLVGSYDPLPPLTLASDCVDLLTTLAASTTTHATTLRTGADAALRMTDEEYDTFVRFQANLDELRRSLEQLSAELNERENVPPPPPPPPSPPSPPWAPATPSFPQWPSWPSSQPPPAPAGSPVVQLLKNTADKLGINFLVSFVQDCYPAVVDIGRNLPVAADYLYKLLKGGLHSSLADSQGPAAFALSRIIRSAFRSWPATPTGDIIADTLLRSHNIDLVALGSSRDLPEILSILKRAFWNPYRNEAEYGTEDVTLTVTGIISSLVRETASPYGRIGPIQLARDLADFAYTLVAATVKNGNMLRYSADTAVWMRWEEWQAFGELQNSLASLRDALGSLSGNLNDLNDSGGSSGGGSGDGGDYSSHYPGGSDYSSHHPNGSDYSSHYPGGSDYSSHHPNGSDYSSHHPTASPLPPWWWTDNTSPLPSSPLSTSPPSALDRLLGLMRGAVDKLGLRFLVQFLQSAYPPVADVLGDTPIAANYIYKLLQHGLDPSLADPSGQAGASLYGILQAAFSSLASSPTGSIIADVALWNHHIDIPALAGAHDLPDLVSGLKVASWWSSDGLDEYSAALVVQSVTGAVQALAWEAVSPYGRISPLQLGRDVVDFSLAVVAATVDHADELRNNADAALYMDGQEYWAFLRLQSNLAELSRALSDLGGSLSHPPQHDPVHPHR